MTKQQTPKGSRRAAKNAGRTDHPAILASKMRVEPPKPGAELSSKQRRYRTAIHEAAHVAVGYYFAGFVGPKGVELHSDDEGYTDSMILHTDNTLEYKALRLAFSREVHACIGVGGQMFK